MQATYNETHFEVDCLKNKVIVHTFSEYLWVSVADPGISRIFARNKSLLIIIIIDPDSQSFISSQSTELLLSQKYHSDWEEENKTPLDLMQQ